MRRGDKLKEVELQPISRFVKFVELIAGEIRTVFVASDDFEAAFELRSYLQPKGYRVVTFTSVMCMQSTDRSRFPVLSAV